MLKQKYLIVIFISAVVFMCGCGKKAGISPPVTEFILRDFTLPIPLFAPNSAWNQKVTNVSTLSASDDQILILYRVLRGDASDLHPTGLGHLLPRWPFMDINYNDYSIPIFRMGTGQQSVLMRDYSGSPTQNNLKLPGTSVTVPSSAGTVRPSGPKNLDADGHVVLYNTSTFIEYDFWQATTVRNAAGNSLGGGQPGTKILEAGGIDYFDTKKSGTNPDTYFSARATGPALLAGLIVPEDIKSGAIDHALAFAIPGPRNTSSNPSQPLSADYDYPASTTETDFFNSNASALAAGQRIRLKKTIVDEAGVEIDENPIAPITAMYLKALRTYGAYLVDGASGFTFYAEDIHTATLDMTDDEVNALIGQASGTPLPTGKTKWQIVIEKLNRDLEHIPIAYGPWQENQDPKTAMITTYNFEVVESPSRETTSP
jgi:hypothetical protein